MDGKDVLKMDIKDFLNFVELIEKQEKKINEKKDQYSEEDIDQIKKLLKAGKPIKDKRLKAVYDKLRDAGIFE
jgi:CRISPR/Cas system-associated exonuclease Cas4 (RecB family)